MAEPNEPIITNLTNLVINKLTREQYDSIPEPNPNELYFIVDEGEGGTYIAGNGITITKVGDNNVIAIANSLEFDCGTATTNV